ncbi:penicillin-binding protein 1A [Desulfosporosinus acididurans]|uniref:Penicillin-binding protein 1A n=1 Tax=Desulfosporosinus acididurans TaxID=476652 RepID=A0A0J1FPU8_9FIRM|nr:penicillin-binding transpeptidase domain-containing protein [Desulfosporosinus acididurans]KLU65357.1 penicillin-binding protein 1A [Desulfosporosinus acididurans]
MRGFYTLANGGRYVQPSCVTKIDNLGQTIYKNSREVKTIYSPESAYMMTDILKGVISSNYGTGHNLKIDGQIVAGKTGTTENSKDGWFCGYSSYYTTVVWCGYDIPKEVDNLFGSTYPGHIWLNYMTKIHEGLPKADFLQPQGIVFKTIDWRGNPTDFDTGTQDMFSKTCLEKGLGGQIGVNASQSAKDGSNITNRVITPKENQIPQPMDQETKAEQDADAALAVLESLTPQSSAENRDAVFLDAQNKIGKIKDKDRRSSYLDRISGVQRVLGIEGSY